MEGTLEAICLKNASCWLKFRNMPCPNPISVKSDRVFFPKDDDLKFALYRLVLHGDLLPGNCKNHGKTALSGYRESCGMYSAQFVIHTDCIEMDFDYFNPWDVVGIVGHAWECIGNKLLKRKTDPRKVAVALKERGVIT